MIQQNKINRNRTYGEGSGVGVLRYNTILSPAPKTFRYIAPGQKGPLGAGERVILGTPEIKGANDFKLLEIANLNIYFYYF